MIVNSISSEGGADEAGNVQFAVDLELVADDADHRYPLAGPVLLLQHVEAVGLDPLDDLAVGAAGLERGAEQQPGDLVLAAAVDRGQAVWVQVQLGRLAVDVEIFGDAHRVLAEPLAQGGVADALLLYRPHRSVGELPLVLVLGDVLRDEAPLGVRAGRVLDHRVHVDAERVAHAPDADVLIEGVVVAVLGQQPDVAFAVCDLIVTGCVIGDISVRQVLDVAHHAVEDLGHLDVGVVVGGDHLAGGPVLALFVGHLPDVLRQLVDRQAGPGVDCHALAGAAAGEDVVRPLVVVVSRAGHEPQVVQFRLTAHTQRADGHRHARAHGRQAVFFAVGLRGGHVSGTHPRGLRRSVASRRRLVDTRG